MGQFHVILVYVLSIIILLSGVISAGVGLFLLVGHKEMTRNLALFDDAKHQIHNMFKVINRYPAVRIHNPPNLTAIDPLVGLDMQTIVRGFGIFFLPFGTVLCIFTVTGLVGTIRNSHRLKTVYAVVMIIFVILEVTVVVIYLAFPDVINEKIRLFFMKGMHDSYLGLSGNNSVSMAWNVIMKKFNCCGVDSYRDFNTSKLFNDKWGEPFHTYTQLARLSIPLVCCDVIEIQVRRPNIPQFNGPCHDYHYINKRGCFSVFLEAIGHYNIYVECLVVVSCLLKILLIITIFCHKEAKPKSTKIHPENELWCTRRRQQPTTKTDR